MKKYIAYCNYRKGVLALLLMACLSLSSCFKPKFTDDPASTLPPITTEGKNTFGFNLDGTLWVPAGHTLSLSKILCVSYNGTGLSITIKRDNGNSTNTLQYDGFSFGIQNLTAGGVGTYNMTDPNIYVHTVSVDIWSEQAPSGSALVQYATVSGTVTISRFDVAANVVSGTFAMDVKNLSTGVIRHITDGRFDVQLNYCQ